MSARARLFVLLLSTPALAFVVVGGFLGNVSARQDSYQSLRVFEDVVQLILAGYVEEVDIDRVMEGALRGLSEGLDPDSAYLTPAMVREMDGAGPTPASASVGLALTRQYYLRIVAARDGSPAARAGLRTGDYVRAIDGQPTRDMSVLEGAQRLSGQPGTRVSLMIIRGNAAEPHLIELVREPVAEPQVTSRLLPADIGYVRIPAFGPELPDQIARQVGELERKGARRLIVDVRRTADGPLATGIEAARLFVPSGPLALLKGRDEVEETVTAGKGDGRVTLPVTLLTSYGTAGAAELFVAALTANDRADVVGERTAGRAGVQKLVRLPEQRGLWLTASRYFTPGGDPIHGRGLSPTVEVVEPEVEFGDTPGAGDPILDAAIARLTAAREPAA